MTHFACSFDKNYCLRAVATHTSLVSAIPDAKFWFLCLDADTKTMVEKCALKNVTCISLEEMGNQALIDTRKERNHIEFAMTSKSNFLSYLIHSGKIPVGDLLVLTDVDIIFYPAIREYLEKVKNDTAHNIRLTPHNFPPEKEKLIPEVGYYNGGFITFIVNDISTTCIDTWAKQCINWCFLWHDYEHGWHTDQMYMDSWKKDYPGFLDVPDKGVNVGTWNITRYKITENEKGELFVEGDPLVCYHFHGLKMYLDRKDRIKPYPVCIYHHKIYYDYLDAMQEAQKRIFSIDPSWRFGFAPNPGILRVIKQSVWRRLF